MRTAVLLATILALTTISPCAAQTEASPTQADVSPPSDLRIIETAHYRIHTDLDDDLLDDLSRRMDAMYEEYAHRLADFDRPDDSAPFEVYLVHTQEKYLHLAGLTLAGTGGSFNPRRHLLAAFLDGQGRDALRRTLQHEAFHQFASQAIGKTIPIWLNEGLAQIFEEGVWTGDGFQLGEVPPRRLRQLHRDIDENAIIDFPRLLSMAPSDWAVNWRDPVKAATQYNQSWAMTHFLIYAADEDGGYKYRSRLIQMLKLLRSGADADTAFRTAFSDNIAGFHDRFMEFAQTLGPTPLATEIENQGVIADMLIEARGRGRTFTSIDQVRAASEQEKWSIHYRRGALQWETAADPKVYFCSPSGNDLDADQLYMDENDSAPLPDLVCRCDGLPMLRTRFLESRGKIDHETIVESAR
jgi:hypothetical protein